MEFRDTEVKVKSVSDTHIKLEFGGYGTEIQKADLQALVDGTFDPVQMMLYNIAASLKLSGVIDLADDVGLAKALDRRTFKMPRS